MTAVNLLAVSGSLRHGSFNTMLLEGFAERVPTEVAMTYATGLDQLAFYNPGLDTETPPPAVKLWRDQVQSADALIIATPEYNSGMPGLLKNALDWASTPFGSSALSGKRVAIMGASPSPGGTRMAQQNPRETLARAGAHVINDEVVAVSRAFESFRNGRLVDGTITSAMNRLVETMLGVAVT